MRRHVVVPGFGLFCAALILASCGTGAKKEATKPAPETATVGAQAKVVELKIGHVTKPTDIYHLVAEKFKQEVEAKSGGSIKVTIVPDSGLGTEAELLTKTLVNQVDGLITTQGSVTSFVKEFAFLDLPFLIRDQDHAHRLLDGPIGQGLSQKLSDAGFYPVGILDFGFRHLTNSKRPVRTPEDAKDLLLRVLPNSAYVRTWELATGRSPRAITWKDVLEALKSSQIDGQENPVSVLTSYKLWDYNQKYASKTGHVFGVGVFLLSAKRVQSLSKEHQAVIKAAGAEAVKESRRLVAESEVQGWTQVKASGMIVTEDVDKEAFRKLVWDKVVAEYGKAFPAEWLNIGLQK